MSPLYLRIILHVLPCILPSIIDQNLTVSYTTHTPFINTHPFRWDLSARLPTPPFWFLRARPRPACRVTGPLPNWSAGVSEPCIHVGTYLRHFASSTTQRNGKQPKRKRNPPWSSPSRTGDVRTCRTYGVHVDQRCTDDAYFTGPDLMHANEHMHVWLSGSYLDTSKGSHDWYIPICLEKCFQLSTSTGRGREVNSGV